MATVERCKYNGKSEFKYVRPVLYYGKQKYKVDLARFNFYKYFDTEREAAIAVDKCFLLKGLEPVNILKKKL